MADPVLQGLPDALRAFGNKYGPLLNQYPSDVLAPLMQADYNRVVRGSSPIPSTMTLASGIGGGVKVNRTQDILNAIQSGQTSYQKKPDTGISPGSLFRNAIGDVSSFVRALPRLPAQMYQEVRDLPQAPADIQQALQEGKPLHIFNAPGLRMLPGSMILGQGTHVLAQHPVFSSLDVAPFIDWAAPALGSAALDVASRINEPAVEAAKVWAREARQSLPMSEVARGTSQVFAESQRRAVENSRDVIDALEAKGKPVPDSVKEIIRKQAVESTRTTVGASYGMTRSQLEEQLRPLAEYRANRNGTTVRAETDGLIESNYRPWKIRGGDEILKTEYGYQTDPLMVPKQVEQVVRRFHDNPMRIPGLDPVMKAFRTSVLPLSPRWHINNAITGAVLSAAQLGPSAILDIFDAIKMARATSAGEEGGLPAGVSQGWSSVGDEATQRAANRAAKIDEMGPIALGKARWNGFVDRMYRANGFMDNMYRSLNYLYGQRKGLAEGLTDAEAQAKGIGLANRVLQDWDRQTPFERQILRTVFPFYGWTHHILKYALKYPVDNPVRAAIVSNIAKNEIDDWKTGLPQDFQNYLFWGKDKMGNQKGFNLRGMNPFSDLDTLFTPAGVTKNLNPVAGGFLRQLGLDTFTGKPNLYQNVEYDPSTGRLVAKTPSTPTLLSSVAEGFLPQVGGLRALLGHPNAQQKALAQTNPAAYQQMVLSNFGLPWYRTVNPGLEIAKSEYAAGSAMQQTLTNAIKTGDYKEAKRYPALRGLISQLEQLDKSGALDQYKQQLRAPAGIQDPAQLIASLSGGR